MKLKFKKLLGLMLVAATAKVSANQSIGSFQNFNLNLGNTNNENALRREKPKLLQKYILKFRSDKRWHNVIAILRKPTARAA